MKEGEAHAVMEENSCGRVERKKDVTSAAAKKKLPKTGLRLGGDGDGLMFHKQLGNGKTEKMSSSILHI